MRPKDGYKALKELGLRGTASPAVPLLAVLEKTFASFPSGWILHIIAALLQMPPPHREGDHNMHWFQVLVLGWISFGLTTVVLMFWLCKRTTPVTKDPVKFGSLPAQRMELRASKLSSELRSA